MAEFYLVDILGPPGEAFRAALRHLPPADRSLATGKFKEIVRKLKVDPFAFGEELYDLKALGMQVRMGIDLPIAIHFGVDAKHRIAIIQKAAVLDRPAKA